MRKVSASKKSATHAVEPVLSSQKELKSASTKNDLQEIKVAADGLSTNASI